MWSNILDVSVRKFLDEINIYISGLWVKQNALQIREDLSQSVESLNRMKDWSLQNKREICQEISLTLPRFPACWSTQQILDLPTFIIMSANSLQEVSSYMYEHLTVSLSLEDPSNALAVGQRLPVALKWLSEIFLVPCCMGFSNMVASVIKASKERLLARWIL